MIGRSVVAVLSLLALSGCFETVTKLTGAESYGGTVRDGLYHQICQTVPGQGRMQPDSAMTLTTRPLPDGRAGIEITGGDTLWAEVQTLRHGNGRGVWLVGITEPGKTKFQNYIVVTADGVSQAFASVVVSPAVEDRVAAADARGDAAAARAAVAAAIDAGDYRMMAAYAAADLLNPGRDGATALPAALDTVARAVGQPLPKCE